MPYIPPSTSVGLPSPSPHPEGGDALPSSAAADQPSLAHLVAQHLGGAGASEHPPDATLSGRVSQAASIDQMLDGLEDALALKNLDTWTAAWRSQGRELSLAQLPMAQQLKVAALLLQVKGERRTTEPFCSWQAALTPQLVELQAWWKSAEIPSADARVLQPLSAEERVLALALKVNQNKHRINAIRQMLGDQLLLQMAPSLRCLNLRTLEDSAFSLQLLQRCPAVITLWVSDPVLTELPTATLPRLVEMSCRGCSALTSLPALPQCRELDCGDCTALTALQTLPMCQKLNCSGCTALTSLPPLPHCEELFTIDCPAPIPELPAAARVFSDATTRSAYIRWEVALERFDSDPKGLLLELDERFLQGDKPLPNIDYLVDGQRTQAVDVGGVRRDFIARLCERLYSAEGERPNSLTLQEGLPVAGAAEEAAYRALGRLLALCYPADSGFKAGPLLAAEAYRALALPEPSPPAERWLCAAFLLLKGAPADVVQLAFDDAAPSTISRRTLEYALYLVDDEADLSQAGSFFNQEANRDKLAATLLEQARADGRVRALAFIAEALRRVAGPRWDELPQRLPEAEASTLTASQQRAELVLRRGAALQERLEGQLSVDTLLGHLEWGQSSPLVSAEDLTKIQGFLNHWITTASAEQRRQFVRAVSGSNGLGPEKLQMQVFNRSANFIPTAHTCFFSLELTAACPDQATFDHKLELLLGEGMAGGGFQAA